MSRPQRGDKTASAGPIDDLPSGPGSQSFPDTQHDEPMHGIGDLATALGGDKTSFTGQLLLLIAKADPDNRARLRQAFPRHVLAWELWMAMRPTPTATELLDRLPDASEVSLRVDSLTEPQARQILARTPAGSSFVAAVTEGAAGRRYLVSVHAVPAEVAFQIGGAVAEWMDEESNG